MKHLSILLAAVVCSAIASAQKLKTQVTSGGDTLISTPDKKIYTKAGAPRSVGDYLKTSLFRINSTGPVFLQLEIQTGRTSNFSIGSGSALDINLENGDVVTLQTRHENQSRISRLDYGCYIFVSYSLPAADRSRLKASPITTMTVHASIGPMQYEIKSKFGDALQEAILHSKF